MRSISRRAVLKGSACGALGIAMCGCRSAPMTGRRQLMLLPESQEISMGLQSYEEITGKEQPSQNARWREVVERVGHRIAAVSGREDYKWEFRLLGAPQQNAFALPGGKVAVYEGIVPICATEAGLAVVMSHEVGHALARHGGERMSQQYTVKGVREALGYMTRGQDERKREMLMKAYGAASTYGVILPYSRKHESEADHMGIMLMAKAGYDPAEAPRFWTRFGSAQGNPQQPEFFSTHPSHDTRSADLAKLLPEAQELFEGAEQKIGMGERLA